LLPKPQNPIKVIKLMKGQTSSTAYEKNSGSLFEQEKKA